MTLGRHRWAVSAGWIPLRSNGVEPAFTSRDQISLLNTGPRPAEVSLTLFHDDRDPVGPYRLVVPPRRMRRVRINDLIDPEAPPLDQAYGVVIDAAAPIVVQFTRQDTTARTAAGLAALAFPARNGD